MIFCGESFSKGSPHPAKNFKKRGYERFLKFLKGEK